MITPPRFLAFGRQKVSVMRWTWIVLVALPGIFGGPRDSSSAERFQLDAVSREQAALEREQMASAQPHTFCDAMAAFRGTARQVTYPARDDQLPGYLYKPAGDGPFPAVIWNHGSEKEPRAQPELAQFYVAQGFVCFVPLRHGHGPAPGAYIVDLQNKLRTTAESAAEIEEKSIALHEAANADVVAAVEWLQAQSFVDRQRIVMSGCSYGGIQTLPTAERGLGIRAFVPFAPGAMSFANRSLRDRMTRAARDAKAPVFVVQAKNDYSVGPCELLGPILAKHNNLSLAKIYEPFGKTNQDGHAAFACRSLGITAWGPDVIEFINGSLATPDDPH
jgi:carboxymethylenebutenolidase